MPSTSDKQHNFFEAIAHNRKFAKKAGVSQDVGKEFVAADKGEPVKKESKADRMYKKKEKK